MTTTPSQNLRITIGLVLLLLIMAALSARLIMDLRAHQQLTQDRAELKHVKYGLLNADNWVVQVTDIVETKVRGLELEGQNRVALKRSLERMLHTLIIEADRYMREQNRSGNWLRRVTNRFRQSVADQLVDLDTLKAGVPQYAEEILKELEKPEARAELGDFLEQVVRDLSQSTFARVDRSLLEAIHVRYGCSGKLACEAAITRRIVDNQPRIEQLVTAVLLLSALLFYCVLVTRNEVSKTRLGLLALCASVLMLCGVLTPMIEVEARISELQFMLLGEPVLFSDEVFYFQSKSVLDVVAILVNTGTADMALVGILIMTFSVLFPLAKLAASFVYLHNPSGLRNSVVTRFFALKSGKWSMADVMVIAIFMAYVGFNGLISSQLFEFSENAAAAGVEVLTTNGTSLQAGFFMFLAFCMANLFASSLIESAIEKEAAGKSA